MQTVKTCSKVLRWDDVSENWTTAHFGSLNLDLVMREPWRDLAGTCRYLDMVQANKAL